MAFQKNMLISIKFGNAEIKAGLILQSYQTQETLLTPNTPFMIYIYKYPVLYLVYNNVKKAIKILRYRTDRTVDIDNIIDKPNYSPHATNYWLLVTHFSLLK